MNKKEKYLVPAEDFPGKRQTVSVIGEDEMKTTFQLNALPIYDEEGVNEITIKKLNME